MKRLFIFLAFLASTAAFGQPQSPAYREVKKLLAEDDYYIGQERYANISEGNGFTNTFTFYAGTTYDIVALSDDDYVTDIDLVLKNPDGSTYREDVDASDVAEIKFTPAYTRTLTIQVKNYRSDAPDYQSRCRFVIGYRSTMYSSLN